MSLGELLHLQGLLEIEWIFGSTEVEVSKVDRCESIVQVFFLEKTADFVVSCFSVSLVIRVILGVNILFIYLFTG